ncbi:conserved hypothetical protein [Rubritalea squalenifaciens DSM 18772]|uniref:Purine nucleoside phosphorylase n=1 Tax=Rubritalea squalenifaciens DSM 18772 TaxID=1123071 RepID=A0A1M6LPT7_9BACT|nr:polyphenol oxidase family protein [Rubritalea squalenifaciens]SHJ73190.1 conserved hypothetical protein [Rubritalea squalenifaciens DSM 18772]
MSEPYLKHLNEHPAVDACFVGRIPGVEVDHDRGMTLQRLKPYHQEKVKALGYDWDKCWRAEQVHGGGVAVVRGTGAHEVAGVDGIISNEPGVMLGIYVADCGPVYLYDPVKKVIGLVHSGKKGTELNIVRHAMALMRDEFGCDVTKMRGALGPCIRPPKYDVDFAAEIVQQVKEAGMPAANFVDCGICTGSDLEHYYSYRIEKGATGRMLALLGLKDQA